VNDDELAAVIAAALALLAARTAPSPPLSRWRLAARIGDEAARAAAPHLRSRWAAAGRVR